MSLVLSLNYLQDRMYKQNKYLFVSKYNGLTDCINTLYSNLLNCVNNKAFTNLSNILPSI